MDSIKTPALLLTCEQQYDILIISLLTLKKLRFSNEFTFASDGMNR